MSFSKFKRDLVLFIAALAFMVAAAQLAGAQVQDHKERERPAPEAVVVAPVAPASVVVDMGDGFWMQSLSTLDLTGEQRTFTLIYFPKRLLTGPDTWSIGIREALVKFVGCEAFTDCTPELIFTFYRRAGSVPVLKTFFEGFAPVYIFPLVASPTSHTPIGIAITD
jgi:hypothetical protein